MGTGLACAGTYVRRARDTRSSPRASGSRDSSARTLGHPLEAGWLGGRWTICEGLSEVRVVV